MSDFLLPKPWCYTLVVTETATFALGCFWQPDDYFSKIDGVLKTTVGYAGGTSENPTYENLGDHAETIEIVFDNSIISYEELLNKFWNLHNPSVSEVKQYSSFIFTNSDIQKANSEKSKEVFEKETGKTVLTQICKATKFYRAEEYHQKYLAKARGEI